MLFGALLVGGPLAYLLKRARRREAEAAGAATTPAAADTRAADAAATSYRFHLAEARASVDRGEAAVAREDWRAAFEAVASAENDLGKADAYRAAHAVESGYLVAQVWHRLAALRERVALAAS